MATLYCRPTDIKTADATISLTSGTVNSSFPLTNIQDLNPAKPTKTTGTAATFRATFGAPVVLEMVSFGPHNLAGATVTLTNGAGLSRPITIPSNREDGLSVNPFDDFSAVAQATRTSTTWDLVITGAAANIAIGEWQLIATKRTLDIRWGVEDTEDHRTIVHETDYGAKLKYWLGVSQRSLRAKVNRESERANLLSLIRSAQGQYKAFILILDSSVNDAWLVDLATDAREFTREHTNITDVDLGFVELQRGLAL